jgi:3-keto-L-gulonate-6-phosphate decarboxylase
VLCVVGGDDRRRQRQVTTVREWTGQQAHALRLATRVSVRDFAQLLGVGPNSVNNWGKRGSAARLRFETQQILDAYLKRISDEERTRFDELVRDDDSRATATDSVAPTLAADHAAGVADLLGSRSAQRTSALIEATGRSWRSWMQYVPPTDAAGALDSFLRSSSRVFLIKGAPGTGKSRLTYHYAGRNTDADFQLHSEERYSNHPEELAKAILRYASVDAGPDALLTLERHSALLKRPVLVVIDGPKAQDEIHAVCRQIDAILRQVLSYHVRFLVVLRTPPDTDLSAHPVVAASIFQPRDDLDGASLTLNRWDIGEARRIWDGIPDTDGRSFDQLPGYARQLARVPLFMQLLKSAGDATTTGPSTAYRLLEFCVTEIVDGSGHGTDAMSQLTALACTELADLTAGLPLRSLAAINRDVAFSEVDSARVPILHLTGRAATFSHDVIREFFLARHIAQAIEDRGKSTETISTLNTLATRAQQSSTARGVLELTIQCLDQRAPELLTAVALSSSVGITSTLPIMLNLAGSEANFANDEVLRSCASRSLHESGLELAKSLLGNPGLRTALADYHARWVVDILRQFGAAIWTDMVVYIRENLPAGALHDLLDFADFSSASDAIFFARHSRALLGADAYSSKHMASLLEHADWRVRAALADGIRRDDTAHHAADAVVSALLRDRDYKVRAAVAEAVGFLGTRLPGRFRIRLVVDENWHVRDRLIRGMTAGGGTDEEVSALILTDPTWRNCPAHVRASMMRYLLLTGITSDTDVGQSFGKALLGTLRELRTGATVLADEHVRRLTERGLSDPHWLVRREAQALLQTPPERQHIRRSREDFRRLRESRVIQVALDLQDLDHALDVAEAAAAAGARFIEVGDPLIKTAGVEAIERIKERVPDAAVVAEMMSSDWGRDQIVLAAQSGADVVLLIGPASEASVSAAVDAGRRLGVPVMLDVPPGRLSQAWVQTMERAGVDGFTITTNIDLGVAGPHPLEQSRRLRSWTKLPTAVSGGFGYAEELANPDWDILIVGRAVTDAIDPGIATENLIAQISTHKTRYRA